MKRLSLAEALNEVAISMLEGNRHSIIEMDTGVTITYYIDNDIKEGQRVLTIIYKCPYSNSVWRTEDLHESNFKYYDMIKLMLTYTMDKGLILNGDR